MGKGGGWDDTSDSSLQVNISGGTTVINAYGDALIPTVSLR